MRHLRPCAVLLVLCAACNSAVTPPSQGGAGAGGTSSDTTSTSTVGTGGGATGGAATGGAGEGGAETGGSGGEVALAPMAFARDLTTALACDDGRVRVFGGLGLFGIMSSQEAY